MLHSRAKMLASRVHFAGFSSALSWSCCGCIVSPPSVFYSVHKMQEPDQNRKLSQSLFLPRQLHTMTEIPRATGPHSGGRSGLQVVFLLPSASLPTSISFCQASYPSKDFIAASTVPLPNKYSHDASRLPGSSAVTRAVQPNTQKTSKSAPKFLPTGRVA